jgi:hypothetical protein
MTPESMVQQVCRATHASATRTHQASQTSLAWIAGWRDSWWHDRVTLDQLAWYCCAIYTGATAIKTSKVWPRLVRPCRANMGGVIGLSRHQL